jgi:hypothetical protein
MDLMKDINKLADEYEPPVEEEHVRATSLLRAMTPPKDVKKSDKLDLSKKKKKTFQSKLKETREENGWI